MSHLNYQPSTAFYCPEVCMALCDVTLITSSALSHSPLQKLCADYSALVLPGEVNSLSPLGLCTWFCFYQKHFPLIPASLALDFGFLRKHFLTLPV